MPPADMPQFENIVGFVLDLVAKQPELEADCLLVRGTSSSASMRLGEIEDLSSSEGFDLGLRVIAGQRQASVSTSDLRRTSLEEIVERAIAMARVAPEDPYCGLASKAQILTSGAPDLDMFDPTELSPERLIELAGATEAAALAVKGVTNSGGADCSFGSAEVLVAASNGFSGQYKGSSFVISAAVIAGEGTEMERDYEYSSARHFNDLESPEKVGKAAGTRAVARLNPRKLQTRNMPVVYAPRVANSLLGHLAAGINGRAVARETSFLKDKLGDRLFPENVRIVDDPLRIRGLKSKPFDGEGLATEALNLVQEGILLSWVMDCASARQLGLVSNGRASRGTSGPPSPATTNLYMEAGELSPEELISDISEGLYVSELIGMGVNTVTGDYSRGAVGFFIENGEITYPVSELTVAGKLVEMFAGITPASDLEFRYGINAPTIRVETMTVAGA